jgi:hypothetical protein
LSKVKTTSPGLTPMISILSPTQSEDHGFRPGT